MSALKYNPLRLKNRFRTVRFASFIILVVFSTTEIPGQSGSHKIEIALEENAPAGTTITTLKDQFPELCRFRLADRSRTLSFTVEPDSGKIVVRNSVHLNFERRPVLLLSLLADVDAAAKDTFLDEFAASLLEEGISSRKLGQLIPSERSISVRIVLKDIAEPPRMKLFSFSLDESADNEAVVGSLTADDQDHNEVLAYRILNGNDESIFGLDGESGVLSVKRSEALNYEKRSLHSLQVQVIDKEGMTAESLLEIHLMRAEEVATSVPPPELATATAAESGVIDTDNPSSVTNSLTEASPVFSAEPTQNDGESEEVPIEPLPVPQLIHSEAVSTESLMIPGTIPDQDISVLNGAVENQIPSPTRASQEPAQTHHKNVTEANSSKETKSADQYNTLASRRRTSPSYNSVSVDRNRKAERASSISHEEDDGSSVLIRDVSMLLIAFSVIGFTVFVMYRRASAARKEALRYKDEDDAKVKAAEDLLRDEEQKRVAEAAEAKAELLTASAETEHTSKSKPFVESASEAEDDTAFDPESLIAEEYFLEPAAAFVSQTPGPESSVSRQTPSRPDVFSDMLTDYSREVLGLEARLPELITSSRELPAETISELREKLETLNARLEEAAIEDHQFPEPSTRNRRRSEKEELDGFGPWEDRPSRYDFEAPSSEVNRSDAPHRDSVAAFEDTDQLADRQVHTDFDVSGSTFTNQEADNGPDSVISLRNELADLFEISSRQAATSSEPEQHPQADPENTDEKIIVRTSEESHLDSVAQYLSKLLDRSKKEDSAEAIFVDRRQSAGKSAGKWDGVDRRGDSQKQKPQVKSYIESYLSEHGGQLVPDVQPVSSAEPIEESTKTVPAPVVRTPVDVNAIRLHMNSFREVATVSVEHALASYKIRQARGKLAWRTMLIIGLVIVAALAIATNSATRNHLSELNWMMGAIICLVIAELCLRLQSIQSHRKELRNRLLEPQRSSNTAEKTEPTVDM